MFLLFQRLCLVVIFTLSLGTTTFAADKKTKDLHYIKLGFFDIHVCNWPLRKNYFKALFSTSDYKNIKSMKVYSSDNKFLLQLDKTKYRIIKRKNKPNKHVFITDLDVPSGLKDGEYYIEVVTNDGKKHIARDQVLLNRIGRVDEMHPKDESKELTLPLTLRWGKIHGAGYYQVFVKDEWSGKLIYQTKLISTNKLTIPKNKLERGGLYSWRVHARDVNEDVVLGDFNAGSMSKRSFFSTAE